MEKGSMIILAIVATLILSIILMAGLTVTTTEVHTTQNYYLNRVSYYKAVEGIEILIDQIRAEADPTQITVEADDFKVTRDGSQQLFITGTLVDLQNGTVQAVKQFTAFPPPPLPSISLGPNAGISPVIWYVPVTAEVTVKGVKAKRSYTEIDAGIYSSVTIAY